MEGKQQVELVRHTIRDAVNIPFVWDISFAEIFSGDSHGFDIVIGNPPYLRQERIADPNLTQEEVTTENKKVYKAKLMRWTGYAYQAWDLIDVIDQMPLPSSDGHCFNFHKALSMSAEIQRLITWADFLNLEMHKIERDL